MAEAAGVFAQPQVCYHIIGEGLSVNEIQALTTDLVKGGAVPAAPGSSQSGNKISLENVTHIIANTIDFPEYSTIAEPSLGRSVVKPEWVTASIKKNKPANPRQYSPDPRMFLSGLVISCADLPEGDKDAIVGYVLAVGGLYSSAITRYVTHIVALTLESDKCKSAIQKNVDCKIVLPHWIDDCLKLRTRLDERPYRLPNPEILTKGVTEKIPDADRNDLRGASSPRPGQLPTPAATPGSAQTPLTVFRSKTVMLHSDLGIGSRLRGILEDLVTGGGGTVTGSVHKADFLICHYRESQDYRIASRAAKDVGNLSWLYHLITHNKWTSPMRRLLHYPIPKAGVPGFDGFRISVSNYNGEARIYLENLAIAAGAQFTKTMKDDNTHLITAHPHSEKCNAAKEWNINIVNHLWLEESYARWQVQTISNPIYTQFPLRTNLGEVVGQTDIDSKAMERHFFPPGSDRVEDYGEITAPKLVAAKNRPATREKAVRTQSAVGAQDVPLRQLPSDGSTPRALKTNRRHTDGEASQTPAVSRSVPPGKENETPSTSGSRSAKAKAAAKLHDLAQDIALFEKESKRVGGVTHGGRRHNEDLVQNDNGKRSKSVEEIADAASDAQEKPAKKAKKNPGPPAMRLLLSGYKRWVGQTQKTESDDRAQLKEYGISVIQSPNNCTHLAAPKVIRTQKFICALAYAPTLLSTKYVDDCLSQNRRLDPEQYLLKDEEFEQSCGYTMADSLTMAKSNKRQLMKGYTIYCTEDIYGGYDTYNAITEANGGRCTLYRARAGANQALRAASAEEPSDPESKPGDVFLLSGTTSNEARLWPKFRNMVEEHGKIPRIVRHDWLLHTALSQQKLSAEAYLLTDKDVEQ